MDTEIQSWLKLMQYDLKKIKCVKADIKVQITIQKKGGGGGRKTAQTLQFKINPA